MSRRQPLAAASEVCLLLTTLAALAGIGRLLEGDWVVPLLASAVGAHVVVTVLRRRGVGLVAAGAVTAGAAVAAIVWFGYGATTRFGIPTADTWHVVGSHLDQAWEVFRDVRAPAPAEPGFLVVCSLALWFTAFVADWAAFRLWVPFEATLPAGTLFVFTSLLGEPVGRMGSAALFAGAVLLFLLVHRTARRERTSHWVGDGTEPGQRRLLVAGGSLAAVAVLGGVVAGPQLPGAEAEALVDYRGSLEGPESRVTISPLVDIRTRLVQQRAVEVFTVRANERAYWRLTALDEFDGRIWRSSGSFGRVGASLPAQTERPEAGSIVEQEYAITALAMLWLPAAYEPRALDADDAPIRYDAESSTFIVDRTLEASDGLTYSVTSAVPQFEPAALAAATRTAPPDARYLDLPPDFPASVTELAQAVTAEASTPYEQALALQEHFRSQYTYDLDVGPGHDDAALERFVFETRRGYCEQFAGAYAAMARAIGLPARVAVGFTPGEADEADPGLFRVRGEHAHAWPEVHVAGMGWVPFEPTPGRGIPGAEAYTGVAEQQAAEPAGEDPGPPDTTPDTIAPEGGGDGSPPEGSGLETAAPDRPDGDGAGTDAEVDETPAPVRWVGRPLARAAPFVGLGIAGYLLAVPVALLAWRAIRRRRAATAEARIRLAWREAEEAAALVGIVPAPAETVAERAARMSGAVPGAAGEVETVGRWLEWVEYGPGGVADADADAAWRAAEQVEAAVLGAAPRRARVLRWLDPRPALRAAWSRSAHPARRVARAGP